MAGDRVAAALTALRAERADLDQVIAGLEAYQARHGPMPENVTAVSVAVGKLTVAQLIRDILADGREHSTAEMNEAYRTMFPDYTRKGMGPNLKRLTDDGEIVRVRPGRYRKA